MGWLVLSTLTLAAAVAAMGITLRTAPEGRAEMGMTFTLVLFALLGGPVLLLGYANLLLPLPLACVSVLCTTASFLASARGRGVRAHGGDILRGGARLLRLPADALASCVRPPSFAAVGLLASALGIAWSVWLGYLAPSESWDGFFYHEPMVGFALQNQGFRAVDLPPSLVVQATNGYPRFCEGISLWFVVFTDRSLIEVGNTLAAPGLMLATFSIMSRFCRDRVTCIGWSAVVLLIPAMLSQLRTTMVDVQVTFFALAAISYATRTTLRLRDCSLAILAMCILIASKSLGLGWFPPIALLVAVRLGVHHLPKRRTSALLVAALGGLALAGCASLTLVRNWVHFNNPVWPITFTNEQLGVSWPGLGGVESLNRRLTFQAWIAQEYHHPTGGVGDLVARDYGYAVVWIVVPLGLAAILVALWDSLRARLRRAPDFRAEGLLLLAGLGLAFLGISPDLAIARFNTSATVILVVCAAWLAERAQGPRLGEGALAAAVTLAVVPWVWTGYLLGLDLDWKGVAALHQRSAQERRTMNFAKFQMPASTAERRERELLSRDLVVFTQELAFVGVLWNWEMSNRVEYLEFRDPEQFMANLDVRQPKWVVVGERSGAYRALAARPQDWGIVGPAVAQDRTVAFRRVSSP